MISSTVRHRRLGHGGVALVLAGLTLAACSGDSNNGTGTGSGAIAVITTTTGTDLDADGYTFTIDNGAAQTVDANGNVTVTHLAAGIHHVDLGSIASNCVPDSASRSVLVENGKTSAVAYNITCGANLGSLEVTAVTGGTDFDLDGYSIAIDGGSPVSLEIAGTQTFPNLTPGNHTLTVSGLAGNCLLDTPSPLTVNVAFGAQTTQTLNVTCSATDRIAFSRSTGSVMETWVGNADGTTAAAVSTSALGTATPSWSPDESSIAFANMTSAGVFDIFTMTGTGGKVTQLTGATASDHDNIEPSWSSTNRIAFASGRDHPSPHLYNIYAMDMTGENVTRLTNDAFDDREPDWSPNASKIVYTSLRSGVRQIFIMDANGSNQTALTTDAANKSHPVFSPDGTKIAFASTGGIWVMNADGSSPAVLANSVAGDVYPTWSADGTKIAFTGTRNAQAGIYWVSADGTGSAHFVGAGGEPDWRP
jgi:Tol biopolymer transport system component